MSRDLKREIQEFLKKNSIKPSSLAIAVGVYPSQITRYLSDERGLSWDTANKIITYIESHS